MITTRQPARQIGYKEWNQRLLRYYFGAAPNSPEWHRPLTSLHVAAEDLQRAAGSPSGSPSDVKSEFLEMFAWEHRERTFSRVASDNEGWRTTSFDVPPFFVHLVVSCLIATDFDNEEAYRRRLNEACANGKQNSTEALPELWEQLRDWLDTARERDEEYRALVLPARRERGWTNIGYSIDLAFPRRGDRDQLVELLGDKHLLGREPTIRSVFSSLEGRQERLSAQFNEVLADFRRTVESGQPRWNHAFWLAVRDACAPVSEDTLVELLLVMNADPNGFRPYLLARSEGDAKQLGFQAAAFSIMDDWPYALNRNGDFELPVSALLAGDIVVARITPCVEDGILGFEQVDEELWSWIPRNRLVRATHCLVRENRLTEFRRLIRRRAAALPTRERGSHFQGWVEIENIQVARSPLSSMLESKIDETLAPPVLEIEVGSGVMMRDGWLGEEGLLPRVVAQQADSVSVRPLEQNAEPTSTTEALELETEAAEWRFPEGRREGAFLVEATFADHTKSALRVRFYGTPLHTGFVTPTAALAERSFVEDGDGDVTRLDIGLRTFASVVKGHDHMDVASDAICLGPTVGEWSDSRRDGFEWLFLPNARPRIRYVGDPRHPTMPSGTAVRCKSAARAWRRCFGRDDVEGPPEIVKTYRAIARRTPLPTGGSIGEPFPKPVIGEPSAATPHRGVTRFIAALSTSAVQRSAIGEPEIMRLIGLAFDLDSRWSLRFALLRAWIEAGVLEEASCFRWSWRNYVVRPPRLVLHRLGSTLRAAVVGLIVPAVRAQLKQLAQAHKVELENRCSLSEWAPAVPLLTPLSIETADAIAHECGFAPSEWLPPLASLVKSTSEVVRPVLDDELPQQLRIQTWNWEDGRFQEGESRGHGSYLYRCSFRNQPDRFEVRTGDGRRWSTRSRAWAFLAAHHFRHDSAFETDGLIVRPIGRSGARIPLPLSRAISVLSPATGGPVGVAGQFRYEYWFPSTRAVRAAVTVLMGSPETKSRRGE